VFGVFADPASWKHWFPSVRDVSYSNAPPHGVGTVRIANVGGTTWVEELLAWDERERYAWTVTRASVPFAAALVESWEFSDDAGGTRIRWTFALDPRLLARLASPLLGSTLARVLRGAAANLEAYVARAA